jgi:hypothetical protein
MFYKETFKLYIFPSEDKAALGVRAANWSIVRNKKKNKQVAEETRKVMGEKAQCEVVKTAGQRMQNEEMLGGRGWRRAGTGRKAMKASCKALQRTGQLSPGHLGKAALLASREGHSSHCKEDVKAQFHKWDCQPQALTLPECATASLSLAGRAGSQAQTHESVV